MKVAQLLVAVVALAGSCRAGLLRVPRVYNALISTNQRLAPSRADTVSLPVVGPVALLPAAAAIVAEEPAPPPAAKNATEAEDLAPAGNHTLVAPLAVYSPYYYPAYPYHYNPYLVPPVAPLVHYGYSYNYLPVLPLAVAHPVPAAAPKPDDKNAAAGDGKADAEKDAVTVEAN